MLMVIYVIAVSQVRLEGKNFSLLSILSFLSACRYFTPRHRLVTVRFASLFIRRIDSDSSNNRIQPRQTRRVDEKKRIVESPGYNGRDLINEPIDEPHER